MQGSKIQNRSIKVNSEVNGELVKLVFRMPHISILNNMQTLQGSFINKNEHWIRVMQTWWNKSMNNKIQFRMWHVCSQLGKNLSHKNKNEPEVNKNIQSEVLDRNIKQKWQGDLEFPLPQA